MQVDTSQTVNSFIRDNHGSAGILIGIILTFIFSLLLALHAETEILNNKVMRVQNALDASISASFTETNLQTRNIPALNARDVFVFYLRENLLLDEVMAPLSGSVASAPVTYEFIVYNIPANRQLSDGNIGGTTKTGELVKEPGIWARVHVPVRPIFTGILGESIIITRHRLIELMFAP